jgi:hypothetical protein
MSMHYRSLASCEAHVQRPHTFRIEGWLPPFDETMVSGIAEDKVRNCEFFKQEPVLRPVLPRTSCEVNTISILMFFLLFMVVRISIEFGRHESIEQKLGR